MAITIRELKMLREVLLTITNISISTRETLHELVKRQSTSEDRDRIKKEIKNIEVTINTTRSLYLFYERRIQEEVEEGKIRRHMEDARVLCGAIREIRREQREQIDQWEPLQSTRQLGSGIQRKNFGKKEQTGRARKKETDLTMRQDLNIATANAEWTEAKSLRTPRARKEDNEKVEETLTLADQGEFSDSDTSTALLHCISMSLRSVTKVSKVAACPATTEERGSAIELVDVENVSKGAFACIMRKMSLKGRPWGDILDKVDHREQE